MKTLSMTTEPFTCPSCIKKIENTLGKTDGVDDVKVMFHSNKIKVSFDDTQTNADDLANAVTKLGYPVIKQKVA